MTEGRDPLEELKWLRTEAHAGHRVHPNALDSPIAAWEKERADSKSADHALAIVADSSDAGYGSWTGEIAASPAPVEDSHAKLAAEIRELRWWIEKKHWDRDKPWTSHLVGRLTDFEVEVEQLGALPRCLCSGPMKCEKCGERWFMPGQMQKTLDEERGRVEEKKAALTGPQVNAIKALLEGMAQRHHLDILRALVEAEKEGNT